MISTRRIATFLAIAAGAAGASGLGASTASAAQPLMQPQSISVADTLDGISTAAVPAENRSGVPTLTQQLQGAQQLGQLHQLTDLAAPVAGAVPSIQ